MKYEAVDFEEKFRKFEDHWAPRIVAEMDGYQFKLVRILGEFVWHRHAEADEAFVVLDGEMVIEFRDGKVALRAGEMFVVPKGVEHRTSSPKECKILLVEAKGVVNTGDAGGAFTMDKDVRV